MSVKLFKKEKPEADDIVLVRVTKESEDYCFYCDLLEYGDQEAIIFMTELKKGKIRSVRKLIKVGDTMYMRVLDVTDKGISLTKKKKLTITEVKYATKRSDVLNKMYKMSLDIHKMYNKFLIDQGKDIPEDMEDKVIDTSLYRIQADVKDLTKMMHNVMNDPKKLVDDEFYEDEFQEKYTKYLTDKIVRTPYVIEQKFKLLSYDSNGIEIIRKILNVDMDEGCEIIAKMSPSYKIISRHNNYKNALYMINKCVDSIEQNIKKHNVLYQKSGNPKVIAQGNATLC